MEDPPSVESSRSQFSTDFPPLRIHHFMIWTALTAAIMAGCMTFDRWARNGPPIENHVIIVALVLMAVVVAGALTIVGSAYFWYEKGTIFPRSPGDLLLMSMAGVALTFCAVIALLFVIFFIIGDDDWMMLYYFIASVPVVIGWSYFQIIGMLRYSNTWQWRLVFGLLLLSPWIVVVSPIGVTIAFIASVLCAAWADWHKSIPHNWTHWCGVSFAVLLGISLICLFANVR